VCRRIPVAGLALILGIDRFMSEARSITNFIGNGCRGDRRRAVEKTSSIARG
jgi:hypothetical protein